MDNYAFITIFTEYEKDDYFAIKKFFDLNGERLSKGNIYFDSYSGDEGVKPLRVYRLEFEGENGTWELFCQFNDGEHKISRIYNLFDFDNPVIKGERICFKGAIDTKILEYDEDIIYDLLNVLDIDYDSWLFH